MRESNKKTIFIYSEWGGVHSLYKPLFLELSKRYNLVYSEDQLKLKREFLKILVRLKRLRKIYHRFFRKQINPLSFNSKPKNFSNNFDLVYATNSIPPTGCKFIMDLEIVSALAGYNFYGLDRDYIKKRLEDSNCKKIICWNKASYITLTKTIDCSKFTNKIEIIPFGISSKKKIEKTESKDVRFLFVCSVNNPQDFEFKGGLIALEVFSKISSIYPNSKFYVRAQVSSKIKNKYKKNKNIIFIEKYLSNEEMEKLFLNADILLEPIPGINLMLDCLNYKIPIIAFDFYLIPEIVQNGKNGLLVKSKSLFGDINDTENYLKNLHLVYFKLLDINECKPFIEPFFEKSLTLIKDKKRRIKMGEYGKKLVENNGNYSLEKNKKAIIKCIEEAMN